MHLSWSGFFLFYFAYRTALSVAAEVLVRKFTSLGDAVKYQRQSLPYDWLLSNESTTLTKAIGTIFNTLSFGNSYIVNFWFQATAFIGIFAFLRSLEPDTRKIAALLLLTPSFNLWSSVASKDAIVVFAVGIICAFIVNLYNSRLKVSIFTILAFYLLYIYKDHYFPCLLFIIGVAIVASVTRQKTAIALACGLVSLVFLYVSRDYLSYLSFEILPHFVGAGSSTREEFWIDKYDILLKAPEGMFISFFGPTLEEASKGHLMLLMSFIESTIILSIIVYFLISRLRTTPFIGIVIVLFGLFWILFANYPLGVMNPGSAIRYRTGYFMIVVMIVCVFLSRPLLERWYREGRRVGSDASSRAI